MSYAARAPRSRSGHSIRRNGRHRWHPPDQGRVGTPAAFHPGLRRRLELMLYLLRDRPVDLAAVVRVARYDPTLARMVRELSLPFGGDNGPLEMRIVAIGIPDLMRRIEYELMQLG